MAAVASLGGSRRFRQAAVSAATLLALAVGAAPAVIAAPPEHAPTALPPLEFAAGDVCDDAVLLESDGRGKDTVFAPDRDGDQRVMTRWSGVTRATNLRTGATYAFQGGTQGTLRFAADGSVRVDFQGNNYFAWYYPGDDADLGAGLWQVSGHATEWYAADGSFIRATSDGIAIDLCEAVGA